MNLKEKLDSHTKWLNGDADGVRANLRRADLRGANLSGADLRWADLRWADLRGANLRRADLSGADLRWADLRWADLSGADLSGANLSGADLRWADLSGADLIVFQAGLWTAFIQPTHIRIGCQYHAVDQWNGFSDEDISRMHKNALDYWKKNKAIIMSIAESLKEQAA